MTLKFKNLKRKLRTSIKDYWFSSFIFKISKFTKVEWWISDYITRSLKKSIDFVTSTSGRQMINFVKLDLEMCWRNLSFSLSYQWNDYPCLQTLWLPQRKSKRKFICKNQSQEISFSNSSQFTPQLSLQKNRNILFFIYERNEIYYESKIPGPFWDAFSGAWRSY